MLAKCELEEMLASTETYRVERTKSTTDKDKFGEMAEAIGLSVAGVRKVLDKLKAAGRIRRIGPDKGGHWEVTG